MQKKKLSHFYIISIGLILLICLMMSLTFVQTSNQFENKTINTVSAEDADIEIINGITYTLIDSSYYEVTGYDNTISDVLILADLNSKPVTQIANNVFKESTVLTSIEIPSKVDSIRNFTFQGCINLEDITFAEGSQLKTIGSSAFQGCTSLTSIKIPANVTTIGTNVLTGCTNLTTLTAPFVAPYNTENHSYLRYFFGGTAYNTGGSIPSKLTTVTALGNAIADYAFRDCTSLTSIIISNSVTTIGTKAFLGCISLNKINVDDNNTKYSSSNGVLYNIDKTTLLVCPNGKASSYTFPSSVAIIGDFAFQGCTGLNSITIPNYVTTIGYAAFHGCTILNSITIPFVGNTLDGTWNTHFGYIFGALSYSNQNSYIPDNLKNVIITSGGTIIADNAFYNCTSLTSIKIPASVTSIGTNILTGCTNLETLTAPFKGAYNPSDNSYLKYYFGGESYDDEDVLIPVKTVTALGNAIAARAFYGCTGLTNVEISNTVTTIGKYAFLGCSSLNSITIPFVGDGISYSHFGYIFGASSYSNQNNYIPSSLKTVIITNSTKIQDLAFSGCSNLTKITIPQTITTIGTKAFLGCISLNEINVDDDNTEYSSLNGVLYNKYRTALLNCPNGKASSYTFPSSVAIIGDYAFQGCTGLINIEIPNSVNTIGDSAFSSCSKLASIIIPISITTIGEYAFRGCTSLTSITIPSGVTIIEDYTFYNCSGLTSITIPASVNSIGNNAFYSCTNLASITLSSGLTNIGDHAFHSCSKLASINIPDSVTTIGSYTFSNCSNLTNFFIYNNVTSIGIKIFDKCTNLYTIQTNDISKATSGNGLYVIGQDGVATTNGKAIVVSFNGVHTLTSSLNIVGIIIPSRVNVIGKSAFDDLTPFFNNVGFQEESQLTTIENSAFRRCLGLSGITIPASVNSIENNAFYGCTGLSSITIPASVTNIGTDVLTGCTNLTTLTSPFNHYLRYFFGGTAYDTGGSIPSELTTVTALGNAIADHSFYGCSGLTNVEISNTVTSIGNLAFYNCTSLTSINIPDFVTTIGDSAFYSCSNLTSITIPNSVTTIGSAVFRNCSKLASIIVASENSKYKDDNNNKALLSKDGTTFYQYAIGNSATSYAIPNDVTTIKDSAFKDCTALTTLTIPSGVTSIGDEAFRGCSNLNNIKTDSTDKSIDGNNGIYVINSSGNPVITDGIAVIVVSGEITKTHTLNFAGGAITELIIPTNVVKIGNYAFIDCIHLIYVRIKIEPPRALGIAAFDNSTGKIYVPSASVNDYKAEWNDYANRIYPDVYIVTFEPNGGIPAPEPIYIQFDDWGKTITSPEQPTKGDFVFAGWCSNVNLTIIWDFKTNIVNSDLTLYAKWTTTINFNANGGSGTMAPQEFTYTIAKNIRTNSFTKIGCSFIGWALSLENANAETPIIAYTNRASYSVQETGITLYAVWEITVYNIFYHNLLGVVGVTSTGNNPETYTYVSDTITFTNPTRNGATFEGWWTTNNFLDGTQITEIIKETVTGNKNLYAKWNLITYGITYVLDNGTNPQNNPTIYTIENTKLLDDATKTGYTFEGWKVINVEAEKILTENGVYASVDDIIDQIYRGSYSNIELEAQWKIIHYTITYNLHGGIVLGGGTNPTTYNIESNAITLLNPNKGSAEFFGWTGTDLNGFVINVTIPAGSTGDRVYTAYFGVTFEGLLYPVLNLEDLEYQIINENELRIDGVKETISATMYAIDSNYSIDTIIYNVNEIGNGINPLDNSIEKIYLCDGITKLNKNSFKNIDLAEGSLISIRLPSTLLIIEDNAFSLQSNLTSITFPNSVTNIGQGAFYFCSALTTLNFTLETQLRDIGISAFANCSNLANFTIPSSVISIGASAFYNCTSLIGATIPRGVTSIESSTFYNCRNLVNVNFATDSHLTNIEAWAFYNCSSLTSITIPNSVTIIKEWALKNSGLTSINLSNNLNIIGNWVFENCYSLTSITIPNSVTSIGIGAFMMCTSLQNISVEETNLNYVDDNNIALLSKDGSILYCYALASPATNYIIPFSVTNIENSAFEGNINLTSITIPNSVTNIEAFAFSNCPNLIEIKMFTTTPPILSDINVFENSGISFKSGEIYVLNSKINAYKTTNVWNKFAEIMNGLTFNVHFNTGDEYTGLSISDFNGYNMPELIILEQKGYYFDGWYYDYDSETKTYFNPAIEGDELTKDVIIYAKLVKENYVIKFITNEETLFINDKTVQYGDAITLPSLSRTGYIFNGWYNNIKLEGFPINWTTISDLGESQTNILLYAKWTPINYRIKFNGNNNTSGEMDNQTLTYDVSASLSINKYARIGYSFVGWSTTPTGKVEYENEDSILNLTTLNNKLINLYAIWNINQYTISFNSNGGNIISSITQDYGSLLTAPPSPVIEGLGFVGWFRDDGIFEDKFNFDTQTMPAEDIILYAGWDNITYTVTFINWNGESINSIEINYGGTISSSDIPILAAPYSNWEFENWYSDESLTTLFNFTEQIYNHVLIYAKWNSSIQLYCIFEENSELETRSILLVVGKEYEDLMSLKQQYLTFKHGYSLDHWIYTNLTTSQVIDNNIDSETKFNYSDDILISANYKINDYKISFDLNYETYITLPDMNITYNSTIENLPTPPARKGYTFNGWYLNGEKIEINSIYNLNKNSVSVADWVKVPVNSTLIILSIGAIILIILTCITLIIARKKHFRKLAIGHNKFKDIDHEN